MKLRDLFLIVIFAFVAVLSLPAADPVVAPLDETSRAAAFAALLYPSCPYLDPGDHAYKEMTQMLSLHMPPVLVALVMGYCGELRFGKRDKGLSQCILHIGHVPQHFQVEIPRYQSLLGGWLSFFFRYADLCRQPAVQALLASNSLKSIVPYTDHNDKGIKNRVDYTSQTLFIKSSGSDCCNLVLQQSDPDASCQFSSLLLDRSRKRCRIPLRVSFIGSSSPQASCEPALFEGDGEANDLWWTTIPLLIAALNEKRFIGAGDRMWWYSTNTSHAPSFCSFHTYMVTPEDAQVRHEKQMNLAPEAVKADIDEIIKKREQVIIVPKYKPDEIAHIFIVKGGTPVEDLVPPVKPVAPPKPVVSAPPVDDSPARRWPSYLPLSDKYRRDML